MHTTIYGYGGIAVTILDHDVAVSVGRHEVEGYVPEATYRCRVAPGYLWLTPECVGSGLRGLLTMAVSRNEEFNFRAALDRIARENLAIPDALRVLRA